MLFEAKTVLLACFHLHVSAGEMWEAVTVASCNLFVIKELPWKKSAVKLCAVCDMNLIVSVYKDEKSDSVLHRFSAGREHLQWWGSWRSSRHRGPGIKNHIDLSASTTPHCLAWPCSFLFSEVVNCISRIFSHSRTRNDVFLREREKWLKVFLFNLKNVFF